MFSCQEPKLAFEGVVASELYPCVLFYSSNPGEKVLNTLCILYCRHLIEVAPFLTNKGSSVLFATQPLLIVRNPQLMLSCSCQF